MRFRDNHNFRGVTHCRKTENLEIKNKLNKNNNPFIQCMCRRKTSKICFFFIIMFSCKKCHNRKKIYYNHFSYKFCCFSWSNYRKDQLDSKKAKSEYWNSNSINRRWRDFFADIRRRKAAQAIGLVSVKQFLCLVRFLYVFLLKLFLLLHFYTE